MMRNRRIGSRIPLFLMGALILTVFVVDTFAGMYMWTDKDGRVQVSDSPPVDEKQTQVKEIPVRESDINRPVVPVEASPAVKTDPPAEDEVVVDFPAHVRRAKVELYTTSWCPWCRKAKAYFTSKGIPFVEYDIEKDKAAARRKDKLDRRGGVPFAVINGKSVHGYSEEAYARALGL